MRIFKKRKPKKEVFRTNPEKAASKVAINSFMMGSLFFILTLALTLSPERVSQVMIFQLVLAIPLLYVSTLAYSKIGYWRETKTWDYLGWITNTLGNIFVFNAVGLMTNSMYHEVALAYFIATILLMLCYSIINVIHEPSTAAERIFKYVFFVIFIIVGGLMPVILN